MHITLTQLGIAGIFLNLLRFRFINANNDMIRRI